MPALLAVGLEGFWGLAISAVALPILGVVRGTDGLPLDSTTQAFRVRASNWTGHCIMTPGASLHRTRPLSQTGIIVSRPDSPILGVSWRQC